MENLVISRKDYQLVIDHCLKDKPLEACGILSGTKEGSSSQTNRVYLMKNTSVSSKEYLMDPEEQFEVFKDIRENDQELIAIFHSHPHSPARPSRKDIEMAYYPAAIYVIISLKNPDQIDFRGFLIENDYYQEIKITVEE